MTSKETQSVKLSRRSLAWRMRGAQFVKTLVDPYHLAKGKQGTQPVLKRIPSESCLYQRSRLLHDQT